MDDVGVDKDGIVEAIRGGMVVWPGHPPTPIAHDEAYSAYTETSGLGARPAIRADDIRTALLEVAGEAGACDPRGLRIREATIIGTLDLNWLDLPFPLGFEGCEFDEWIWADHLSLPQLVLDGCELASFGGTGLVVHGRLLFFDCKGVRQVFLPQARLGTLELRSESFDEPADVRLVLDQAHIEELVIDYYAQLHGGVEQFTSLAELLPSTAFDTVRVDRVIATAPEPSATGAGGWLTGGEVTSPAHYLAAWLAGDKVVPHRRPSAAGRLLVWVDRWSRNDTQRRYVPQTWQRFADGLESAGMGEEARELRIEAERFRSRAETGRLRQLGSTLLFDLPIRYGYRNSRVGWILAALFLLAAAVVQLNRDAFVATGDVEDGRYPGLWPLAYALDVVVSPVGTGQADGWWTGASAGVATALIVIKLLSWLLGGLFVAGVSANVKRSG